MQLLATGESRRINGALNISVSAVRNFIEVKTQEGVGSLNINCDKLAYYAIKYGRIRIRHNKPLFSGLPGSCEQEMRVELEGYVEGRLYHDILNPIVCG